MGSHFTISILCNLNVSQKQFPINVFYRSPATTRQNQTRVFLLDEFSDNRLQSDMQNISATEMDLSAEIERNVEEWGELETIHELWDDTPDPPTPSPPSLWEQLLSTGASPQQQSPWMGASSPTMNCGSFQEDFMQPGPLCTVEDTHWEKPFCTLEETFKEIFGDIPNLPSPPPPPPSSPPVPVGLELDSHPQPAENQGGGYGGCIFSGAAPQQQSPLRAASSPTMDYGSFQEHTMQPDHLYTQAGASGHGQVR